MHVLPPASFALRGCASSPHKGPLLASLLHPGGVYERLMGLRHWAAARGLCGPNMSLPLKGLTGQYHCEHAHDLNAS